MKKRNQILAGVLAVLLGVSPSGVYGEVFYDVEDVAATDAVAQEITDVQDEESEQPEEVTAGEESQEAKFTSGVDSETEDHLFTDGADTNAQDLQEGTILEYVEEELASPLIVNGEPGDIDGIHVFSLEEYDGSYGHQLDGMALEVYNTYVSNLFVNYSTFNGVSYEYQASKPVTFEAKVQDNQLVQDEAYDEAILQVRVNMQAALDAFTYDYPEVFWMRGSGYSYSISATEQNGKYTGIISEFTMMPSLVEGYNTNITDNMNNFLENADAAAAQIAADTNGKSLYEKVKAIHDYVCKKAVYDAQNNLRVHSAGPMFIGDGHVVCEGYAKAMLILCRKLGIECACIGGFARNSSASSGEAHMWNYVKMDNDTWYLVDATWDDQLSGIRTTYLLAGWNSKGFNHNTLREERTEKDTFSSPTEFTSQAFIYPLISYNSYLTDTETSPGHQLSKTDSKAATCTEAGNTAYWYCSVCKKYFSDEDEKKEISLADTVIPATGHQLSKTEGKKATCTEAGNTEYWYCSACKKYFSDEAGTKETTLAATVVPATGHQLSKRDSKAATCTEAGNTEYWYCSVCKKYFSDEAGTKETTLAATVVPAPGHQLSKRDSKAATCTEAGNIEYWNCSVCGKYFRDSEGRQEILLADTAIPAGHQLNKRDSKAATCTEAGNTEYWYCSACKKYFSDEAGTKETTLADTVLPAIGHQLNKTDSKAATCTEAGNTEYWTCNACGKYFSDEAGTNETRLADTVIPATGHHYGEYQLTKEATALEEGVRTAYCSCGAYVTVTVPALTPSIKLNVSSLRLRVKQKYTVKVTGLAKGDSVISWSTGNKKIARVSQKGVVTGKARGNTIITIRLASGYTKKIRVYVQKGIVKTTALKISNTRLTLKKGRSYTLRTTVAPVTSQEKVTFKSSNSKVVSVNAKGKIYAKKKGRARITVRSGKKRRVCVVTVE
ncbi:transglutaminase domain-containing protein [Blautia sp. 1033sp1_1033st1_G9_1033SCRN_220408]|uniref:transglutaminase domain-containing protein n=2 Tax=Blautia TaxID=572511 RepID=UPI0034A218FC